MFRSRMLLIWFAIAAGACSTSPQVRTVQPLSDSADAPYENVLVIFLFSKFDHRRYLETEIVSKLSELGTNATASTSLVDSRTPAVRETFLKMVNDTGADAVLVAQLVSTDTKGKMVDMNPQATYNIRPTYYYNVFSVDVEEYVEPQAADFEHSIVLGAQLYSVRDEDAVWAIETQTKIKPNLGELMSYSVYVDEADAIVTRMSTAGLIGK